MYTLSDFVNNAKTNGFNSALKTDFKETIQDTKFFEALTVLTLSAATMLNIGCTKQDVPNSYVHQQELRQSQKQNPAPEPTPNLEVENIITTGSLEGVIASAGADSVNAGVRDYLVRIGVGKTSAELPIKNYEFASIKETKIIFNRHLDNGFYLVGVSTSRGRADCEEFGKKMTGEEKSRVYKLLQGKKLDPSENRFVKEVDSQLWLVAPNKTAYVLVEAGQEGLFFGEDTGLKEFLIRKYCVKNQGESKHSFTY